MTTPTVASSTPAPQAQSQSATSSFIPPARSSFIPAASSTQQQQQQSQTPQPAPQAQPQQQSQPQPQQHTLPPPLNAGLPLHTNRAANPIPSGSTLPPGSLTGPNTSEDGLVSRAKISSTSSRRSLLSLSIAISCFVFCLHLLSLCSRVTSPLPSVSLWMSTLIAYRPPAYMHASLLYTARCSSEDSAGTPRMVRTPANPLGWYDVAATDTLLSLLARPQMVSSNTSPSSVKFSTATSCATQTRAPRGALASCASRTQRPSIWSWSGSISSMARW